MSQLVGVNTPPFNAIRVLNQQGSPLLWQPLELVTLILKNLNIQGICACKLVCKQLYLISSQDAIWENLLMKHFPFYHPPFGIRNCQKDFKDQFILNSNFVNAVHTTDHMEEDEYQDVIARLVVDDGKLFSGSFDGTINVWDIKTNTCIATFHEHTSEVLCLAVSNGKLFSGSGDQTIKIWDINSKECIATLDAGGDKVFSFAICDKKLYSCSLSRTIQIWDLDTNKCIGTFDGHAAPVNHLAISEGRLFSGSSAGEIKIWDLNTLECTGQLAEHNYAVFCLTISDGKLISGSADGKIKIWELDTLTCVATLEEHTAAVSSMVIAHGKLFSSSYDNTIKIWDLHTKKCIATFKGDQESVPGNDASVLCIAMSGGKIFSGAGDDRVVIWDFKAEHNAVFKEIVDLLKSGFPNLVKRGMDQFQRMPKAAKNKIYVELHKILYPEKSALIHVAGNILPGLQEYLWGHEDATPLQRAQAIDNYLDSLPKDG